MSVIIRRIGGAGDYDTTIYRYDSNNILFVENPFATSSILYNLFYNGFISADDCSNFNYYKNDTNYLGASYYTLYDINTPVLYQRNLDILPQEITNEVVLYIDDFNLKKRFNFGLTIPVRDENTKYFLFLNDYTRNTYNSINASFKVITIDLPLDYDSLNYENYLYYDAILKKYLAPAGAEIKIFSCNVDSGNTGTLTLLESYTGERNPFTWNDIDMTYYILNGFIDSNANTHYLLDTLIPTSAITYNNFLSNIFINALDFYTSITGDKFVINSFLNFFNAENTEDFIYKYLLQVFYYDFNLLESYDNFIGGNCNIVSYENSRNSWNKQNIYNLFRKTNVYTQENKFLIDSFVFNYSDSEDVTSLLPENTDTNYLSSPIYKDNVESSSGGYITYNITNIYNYNDIIINYGQDNSNMRELTDENYYKDFNTNNNIVIDSTLNEDIKIVELTSDTKGLIGKIYETLLRIENKIGNIGEVVTNNIDNITNTTKNYFTILFVPDFLELKEDLEEVNETAEEHLGFVYQPFIFISFLFESIQDLNDDYIVFHSPPIELFGYEIFPEVYFDFNEQLFNINEHFIALRSIQLLLCNATMIFMFINFMIRTYEGVFKDDN